MITFSRRALRRYSFITVLFFVLSMFGSYATTAQAAVNISLDGTASLNALSSILPQVSELQSKIQTTQSTIKSLEAVCEPIHDAILPTDMEAMSIAERVKAILNNAKNVLKDTANNSSVSASEKIAQGASLSSLSTDEKIAYGVNQLGAQAAKIPVSGKAKIIIQSLKEVLTKVKGTLGNVVTNVREKIFNLGQRAGLIDENKIFEDGKVIDKSESKYPNGKKPASQSSKTTAQAAAQTSQSGQKQSFTAKLSQGVSNGIDAAKASLKNSFSVQNLAMTTTIAVGTNLAIDVLNGEKPSLKKAVKQVASLEFAANVAGSAVGAAGGQFVSTLVKTFVPGIAGQLIGSVIPVMFSSASGQLASNLVSGIKNGEFSVSKAFEKIDKASLVGSSIGSTVGSMLGSLIPIPVVGSVVGGVVGGFIGSKIAKWVAGKFTKNKGSSDSTAKGAASATTTAAGAAVSASSSVADSITVGSTAGNISYSIEDPVLPTEEQLNSTNGSYANTVSSDINTSVPSTSSSSSSSSSVSTAKSERQIALEQAKEKYYNAYLLYNRQVQSNDQAGAKATFELLKQYSDEYYQIKKSK